MALTGTSRGANFDETAAQTTAVVTPASNCTAGALLVLWVAYDNSGTNGADPYVSIVDTKLNTWTARQSALTDPGAANAGCCLQCFTTSQDGGALTTGDTITVSFGATVVPVRAWTLEEWTAAGTAAYVTGGSTGTVSSANATTTPSITSGSITSGHGISAALSREAADAASVYNPGDSGNGSWSTAQHAEPSVATGNAGITVISGRKVTTGTGTQVFDATTQSRDFAAGWIEIEETGVPTYTLTLNAGANGTAAASGSNPYNSGTVITLTATPASGYRVASWTNSDDDSLKTNANTLTIAANTTVTVTFEAIPATTPVAEYEPCYIDFGTAGTAYIQHVPDATSELLDLISAVNADWSMIVPGYLLSSLNGNIFEAWDNVNNHRLLTLAVVAGSLVGAYYEDAEAVVSTASCASVAINQHAFYAISYDSSAKKITVMFVGETGSGTSALAAQALTTPGDCTHIRIGTRTRPALKGGIGYVVFKNHQITLADLVLCRDSKRICAPLDCLDRSGANLGGTFTGKTYTSSRFGVSITKVAAPDDLDGSSGTAGIPNGQTEATLTATNICILDVDRSSSWISVSSVATTVSGTMTYRTADYWGADYWMLSTLQYGQATNPTAVNVAGRAPAFRGLAIGSAGGATKLIGGAVNSREQARVSRKYTDGNTYRETISGGMLAAGLGRAAGTIQVPPATTALSEFGMVLSSGRSASNFSVINSAHSFTRFGRGAGNGSLGPGTGVRGAVGGSCTYQTLTETVSGSLYAITSARRQRMMFMCYPGGPVVDVKRYGSNTSVSTAGTQISGGTSQVNCQTASSTQIAAAPTVVSYGSKAITDVTTGAGGTGGNRVVTAASHGYSNGDRVTISLTGISEIDFKTWTIGDVTANTFSLSGATGSGTSTTGTVNPCKIVISGTGHGVLAGHAVFVASNSDGTKQCIDIAAAAGSEGGGNTTITLENGFDTIDGPPAANWLARTGRAYFEVATADFAAGESAFTYQGMRAEKASGDIGDVVILEEGWWTTNGGYAVGGSGWGGNGWTNQRAQGHATYPDPVTGLTHWIMFLAALDLDSFVLWPANNQGTDDPPSLLLTITTEYRAAVGANAEVGWLVEWSRGTSTNPSETNNTSSPVSSTGGLNYQVYGSANAAANEVFFITIYDLGGTPIEQLQSGKARDAAHASILGYADGARQLFEAAGGAAAGGTGGGVALSGSGAVTILLVSEDETAAEAKAMDRTNGRRLILAAASAVGTFTLSAGRIAIATLRAGASHWSFHESGRFRGCNLRFWANANDKTATVRVWRVSKGISSNGGEVDAELEYLGSIAATSGNINGVAGGNAGASDYLCDTLDFTPSSSSTSPKGPFSTEQTALALGEAFEHSPADNTPAKVTIPNIGSAIGLVFELCLGNGAGGGSNPATAINGDVEFIV